MALISCNSTTVDGNEASYETGYIVAGSLGYCWHYGLRLEAEYAFRRNDIREIAFLWRRFFQTWIFPNFFVYGQPIMGFAFIFVGCAFWNIQPFIGAGIGYDFQQMHSSNSRIIFNQKWNHFSWQLMAGLAYPIFLQYRDYFGIQIPSGRLSFL